MKKFMKRMTILLMSLVELYSTNAVYGDDSIPVSSPKLPKKISSYIKKHGLKIPNDIWDECNAYLSSLSKEHPFLTKGNFDGDGKLDYAVAVVADSSKLGFILVFLSTGNIHKLQGNDFIYTEKRDLS